MAYKKFTGEEYIDTDLVAKLNQDFDACGKLASNNTWTGNNYWNGSALFNANLTIRGSATTPGDVSTYLWLGTQPEGSEQTPSIARNKMGDLVMHAADYRSCYLRSGIQTSFASVYNSDGTVEFSSLNNTPWGKYTNANGLELTVNKTPTVNTDVSNKKYVDDSIANGDVNTATKLATARTITANLASSTAGSFDGSANITVGVTGTLPIANGGTGLTSAPSMLVNLASRTATSPLQASPRPGVTGTLPIANGGTGATTAAAARTALGCAPAYTYSTTDLTAGSSALTTGTLYIVYE